MPGRRRGRALQMVGAGLTLPNGNGARNGVAWQVAGPDRRRRPSRRRFARRVHSLTVPGCAGMYSYIIRRIIATIPVLLFDATAEFDVVRTVLGIAIGAMGYLVARVSGGKGLRSLGYGGLVLLVAVAVAAIKNLLSDR